MILTRVAVLVLLAAGCMRAGTAPLIEAPELKRLIPHVRVLDVRPRGEYEQGHIPAAVLVDTRLLDDLASNRSGLPIAAADAAALFSRLGVSNQTDVVVYGAGPWPARLLFDLEFLGHDRVRVLNGGWQAWLANGGPRETAVQAPAAAQFRPSPRGDRLVTAGWIRQRQARRRKINIIDARTAAEFHAPAKDGTRGGHIPGAVNLPWQDTLGPDGRLKTPADLRAMLTTAEIDFRNDTVAYCGAGIRAAQFYLVFRAIDEGKFRLYDASWQEWSTLPDAAVEP